ncbi:hypothetical protein VTJ83DRAFT_7583 [Remersonia thermophila]|uniref:Uncharacterized protein n=1 Tax=Remersonia thermophila TaxID=72144 RepID=A0ABR4D3X2_9PEZI
MQGIAPQYVWPPRKWERKLGLRLASVLSLIIAAGLVGSLGANKRVRHYDGLGLVALSPGIGLTFLWDVAEIICIAVRGGHRGMHPGAIIGVDLLMWLGWICETGLFGYLASYGPESLIDGHSAQSRTDPEDWDWSRTTPEDRALENEIQHKSRAAAAFMAFLVIVHFTLFVIGCREEHIRSIQRYHIRRPIPEEPLQELSMEPVTTEQTQTQQEKPPPYMHS